MIYHYLIIRHELYNSDIYKYSDEYVHINPPACFCLPCQQRIIPEFHILVSVEASCILSHSFNKFPSISY